MEQLLDSFGNFIKVWKLSRCLLNDVTNCKSFSFVCVFRIEIGHWLLSNTQILFERRGNQGTPYTLAIKLRHLGMFQAIFEQIPGFSCWLVAKEHHVNVFRTRFAAFLYMVFRCRRNNCRVRTVITVQVTFHGNWLPMVCCSITNEQLARYPWVKSGTAHGQSGAACRFALISPMGCLCTNGYPLAASAIESLSRKSA